MSVCVRKQHMALPLHYLKKHNFYRQKNAPRRPQMNSSNPKPKRKLSIEIHYYVSAYNTLFIIIINIIINSSLKDVHNKKNSSTNVYKLKECKLVTRSICKWSASCAFIVGTSKLQILFVALKKTPVICVG